MNKFPLWFIPDCKEDFPISFDEYVLGKLREEVYINVVKHSTDSTKYFDLDDFNTKYVNDMKKMRQYTEQIMAELRKLGWTVATSFGRTGLFVYHGERPVNLWPDE